MLILEHQERVMKMPTFENIYLIYIYIFFSPLFFRFPHSISRLYSTRPKLAELIHWTQVNLIRADHSPRCQSCLLPRLLLVLVLVRNLYFYILLGPHYGLLLIRPSSNKTSVIHPLRPPNRDDFLFFFCQLLKGSLHTDMEPGLLIKRGERKQHSGRREDGEEDEEEEEGGQITTDLAFIMCRCGALT